jgi:hypothetical protein
LGAAEIAAIARDRRRKAHHGSTQRHGSEISDRKELDRKRVEEKIRRKKLHTKKVRSGSYTEGWAEKFRK